MTKMSDTTIAILKIIADAPEPIKSDAIRQHTSLRDAEATQISNALFNLKKGGFAVADAARHYSITARGRAALSDNGTGVAVNRKSRGGARKGADKKPNLTTAGIVESKLRDLVIEAQAAIDTYIQSIGGDKDVYAALVCARDEAADALGAYHRTLR